MTVCSVLHQAPPAGRPANWVAEARLQVADPAGARRRHAEALADACEKSALPHTGLHIHDFVVPRGRGFGRPVPLPEGEAEEPFDSCVEAEEAEAKLRIQLSDAVRLIAAVVGESLPSWQAGTCPPSYFDGFAQEVVALLERFYLAFHSTRLAEARRRLAADARGYEREKRLNTERGIRARGRRSVGGPRRSRRGMEEEMYFYEPLWHIEAHRQKVMRDIINQRLRSILNDPDGLENLRAGIAKPDPIEENLPSPESGSRRASALTREAAAKSQEAADRAFAELEQLRAEKERKKKERKQRAATAAQKASSANQEFQDAQNQLAVAEKQKSDLLAHLAELRRRLKEDQDLLEELRRRLQSIECDISDLLKQLSELKKKAAEADVERRKTESQLQRQQEQHAAAQAAAARAETGAGEQGGSDISEDEEDEEESDAAQQEPTAKSMAQLTTTDAVDRDTDPHAAENAAEDMPETVNPSVAADGSAQHRRVKVDTSAQREEEARIESERRRLQSRVAELEAAIEALKQQARAPVVYEDEEVGPSVEAVADEKALLKRRKSVRRFADDPPVKRTSTLIQHETSALFKRLHGDADKRKLKMSIMQDFLSKEQEEKLLGQMTAGGPAAGTIVTLSGEASPEHGAPSDFSAIATGTSMRRASTPAPIGPTMSIPNSQAAAAGWTKAPAFSGDLQSTMGSVADSDAQPTKQASRTGELQRTRTTIAFGDKSSMPSFCYPSQTQIDAMERDAAKRKDVRVIGSVWGAGGADDADESEPGLSSVATSRRASLRRVDDVHPDGMALWQASRRSSDAAFTRSATDLSASEAQKREDSCGQRHPWARQVVAQPERRKVSTQNLRRASSASFSSIIDS